MAEVSSAEARHQPMRQPVALQVFESPLIVTVRSAIPGSDAIEMCSAPS
jgi:hypothetical protein